jgi:glycosyltransferase involved in cell wall biosynthesis
MISDANSKSINAGRRTRVLIAAPSLDIYGGQALMAARLIERLREEPALEVAFQPHNPRLPRGFGWLQQIKYVRTIATTLAYLLMLIGRAWHYDIIHVFSASYYSYLFSAVPALLIGKLYGKKTILNYRSGEAADHLTNWRSAAQTMRWADRIVVPSGYLVDVFAQFGLPAEAIFNTIALDRFGFRERRPLRPLFLSARLLEPLYNVACTLRAFALVQQRYTEAQLIIAADGSERGKLERLARELDLHHTRFIGKVDYQRMPDLLDAADIYLNANDLDNMPSSLIECMAAGLPVVSTNAGGIPYIITHEQTGLLVACNDHQAMALGAIRLLEDQQLAKAIASRARRECEKYQWSAVRNEWLSLYRELVDPKIKNHVADKASVKSISGAL